MGFDKMQFQKFQSKLPLALILVFAFLFACTQQVNERDVNKTTEILNKLAEIQGIEKPNFVNATKVNLIRIEYKWNNQTLIVYTDEKNEKIIGLTPGREENISDVLKQLNDIENSSKQMLDIISKENYVSVKIEEPNNAEFKGNENANIVIIEFADFQCPYCLQFFKETEKPLEQAYVNTGIAKFYYMHMPLVDIHNQALPAALASECAREQGKFWDYHDALFNNQQVLSNQTYENIAKELNLNIEQWNSCYEQRKYLSVINSHAMFAQGLRISGTPAPFLIFKKTGLTAQQKAQLINYNKAFYNANGRPSFILVTDNQNTGILISGALPFGVFQQVIEMIK